MERTIREKIITYGDILMRVPLVFIIDELLRISSGTADESKVLNMTESDKFNVVATGNFSLDNQDQFLMQDVNNYFFSCMTAVFKFAMCCYACIAVLCFFLLSTRYLVVIYMWLISIGIIYVSHWSNVSTIKAINFFLSTHGSPPSILDDILNLNLKLLMNYGPGFLIIQNYVLQSLLACIFCYIHLAPRHPILQKLLVLSFLAPSIIGIAPFPTAVLDRAPVFATLLPLAVNNYAVWHNNVRIAMTLHAGYRHAKNFVNNYGMSTLAETHWSRLKVPSVLRTFWILRVAEQVVQILVAHYGEESFTYYGMIRTLLVNGCETLTALLGMTSIISYICHYIGCFSLWVLMIDDDDEKNIGTVSAVLFYILALQTGLTSLDQEKRIVRLYQNFCLLFAALLHFVHNIVNPVLMSLSASYNPALHRHVRALALCAVLIIFPKILLVFLWSHFSLSTWLLAVSVFSIEVIVKVLVSLAIYSLFLFDAYRNYFWEQLDDCVYLIRSFGNTVEFSCGLVLFVNGFWILVYESGGAIRAIMMCIHAYFNIWCEATAGWSVFMKRRTAVNKINSLPEAKVEQLRALDDVCAICYQEMRSAKVTRCNHYFHGVCLRKWLYVQNRCPLCHQILYKVQDNQANPVT